MPPLFSKIASHLQRGKRGEKLAVAYLKTHGLTIIRTNVSFHQIGEIDIIAQDGEYLVFIEVRTRKKGSLISAAQSITPKKQQKWYAAAQKYLQTEYSNQLPPCRFDAVCIEIDEHGRNDINWLKSVM